MSDCDTQILIATQRTTQKTPIIDCYTHCDTTDNKKTPTIDCDTTNNKKTPKIDCDTNEKNAKE